VDDSIARHRFSNELRYRDAHHPHQTALTPPYVLDPVRDDLGGLIGLDPCTTEHNPTGAARFYFPPKHDGLSLPWDADTIFVNPPYGKAKEAWVKRCVAAGAQGRRVILLMPARTEIRTSHAAAATATEIVLLRGRVKFGAFGEIRDNGRQMAASHGSGLFAWNVALKASSALGTLVRPVTDASGT
jgi:hypothetical protein